MPRWCQVTKVERGTSGIVERASFFRRQMVICKDYKSLWFLLEEYVTDDIDKNMKA